jgi:ribosomal protein S18 acetylase RimI-like enzyme
VGGDQPVLVAGGSALSLRTVTAADEPFLKRLYASTRPAEHAALGADAAAWDTFVGFQLTAQDRSYRAHHPDASFDVVLEAGEPVGRLIVDRGPEQFTVLDISLLAESRNRGLGTQLLSALIGEARDAAVAVGLHVERGNERALALYRRLGFRTVGEGELHLELAWTRDSGAADPGAAQTAEQRSDQASPAA